MTYQFKIQIKGITKSPVWRRVFVADTFTFQQFHFLIQEVFGWGKRAFVFVFRRSLWRFFPHIRTE